MYTEAKMNSARFVPTDYPNARRDFYFAKLHAATDCPTKDPIDLGRVVMATE